MQEGNDRGLARRYRLIERVGQGSGSQVFCALDLDTDTLVAIKTTCDRAPRASAALHREARILARIRHPNVAELLDVGVVVPADVRRWPDSTRAGAPFLVLRFAAGGSLQQLCGALGWIELRPVMEQLLGALACLHDGGLVHRDIKPANVLVASRSPLCIELADLELACAWSSEGPPRLRDPMVGTPAYMAPEQFVDRRMAYGPSTDLYACGSLAWALANGAPPHGVDPEKIRAHHGAAVLPHPSRPLPRAASDWLARLLARDPGARFASARAALDALARTERAPTRRTAVAA